MANEEDSLVRNAPDTSEDDCSTLVAEARKGSRLAFARIVDAFQERVFRMAYVRTRSRMDAEDLTQDIFLQAYQRLENLKEEGRFRPWLMSIAVNRIRDFLRKKRIMALFGLSAGHQEDGETDEQGLVCLDSSPLNRLLQQEFWNQVTRFADRLSRWEREVFILRFLDQLALKEIAMILGKSESAVKTHLYRAMRKFRDDAQLLDFLNRDLP